MQVSLNAGAKLYLFKMIVLSKLKGAFYLN